MPKRVLVVDDDPAQRRILEETIKRFGYNVETADSGDAALAALKADSAGDICLILLDLVMPGTDGMAVLSAMRSLPRKPPAIVQTGQWQHRCGHRGHARRRRRFRGQAGEPRAARSLHQERAEDRGAGRRDHPHEGHRQRRSRLCRPDRRQRGHEPGHRPRQARRQLRHSRPDRGRIGRRQGADRPRHPGRKRPQIEAFRHRQLRRHPREPGREHPVRPREGLLHRRRRKARRQVRRSRRRHAVPRRDRRAAARCPGEAAARAARRRDRSRRRQAAGQGRLPADLGDQPEPDQARCKKAASARTSITG